MRSDSFSSSANFSAKQNQSVFWRHSRNPSLALTAGRLTWSVCVCVCVWRQAWLYYSSYEGLWFHRLADRLRSEVVMHWFFWGGISGCHGSHDAPRERTHDHKKILKNTFKLLDELHLETLVQILHYTTNPVQSINLSFYLSLYLSLYSSFYPSFFLSVVLLSTVLSIHHYIVISIYHSVHCNCSFYHLSFYPSLYCSFYPSW